MQGSAAPGFDARTTRRNRIVLTGFVLALVCLGGALGGTIVTLANRHHLSSGHFSSALAALLVSVGVMAVIVGAWTAWLYRRPTYREIFRFSFTERRRVARKLLKGRPLTDAELPTATALLELHRQQGWLPWVYVLQLPLWGLNAAIHHGLDRWLNLTLVAFWIVMIPWIFHQRRQMRRNYDHELGRRSAIG